jgi:membrane protease YdiL (CAAX protease family)
MPPPSPAIAIASLGLLAALGVIGICGPYVWFLVGRRLYRGEPVLEHEPRRLATWGFIDLVAFGVMWIAFTLLIVAGVRAATGYDLIAHARSDDDNVGKLYAMLIDSVGRLLAMLGAGLFILLRTRCSLRDLGFSTADLPRDLRVGAAAFCALAIPTYGLQALLTLFWKSEHPLIESLKTESDPQFLAIALFAAVISAPLAEEFGFRVLFQGWLEKMFDPAAIWRPNFFASLFAGERIKEEQSVASVEPEIIQAQLTNPEPRSIYFGRPPEIDLPANPYKSPVVTELDVHLPAAPVAMPRWITDVIPIFASAAIFALMHLSHGPDFIPLMILAAGLGYLYRRTHRITPGLVVHFLLNAVSMLALCLSIYGGATPDAVPDPVEPSQEVTPLGE